MGANLSLLAPHAHTVALRSYVDVLPGYKFLDVINDSRFLKTIRVYDSTLGSLLVVKVFIKPPQVGIRLNSVTDSLAKESRQLAQYPNVLPWKRIIETDLAGYLVRQLVRTNLYDRISLRPFLEPVEKLWIVYQLLRTVSLLHHDLHTVHGDIKTENLLVTSSNWVVLADFAQHFKPCLLPDDNPSEFVFYFDSSDRRSCYLAPERFYQKNSATSQKTAKLTDSMDLFSLGCVIAELYMDGEPTFTLSDLYRYKRGDFQPNFAAILDPDIREMVKQLLSINPNARPLAKHLLEEYRGKCFPEYFDDFLYDFMYEMNSSDLFAVPEESIDNCSSSDLKIDRIYDNFSKASAAFGYSYKESTESEFGEKFPFLRLGLSGLPKDYVIQPSINLAEETSHEAGLIVLDLICSLLASAKRPQSRIKAIELILAFSEQTSDSAKLDRLLPYLCSLLDEFLEDASENVDESSIQGSNFTVDAKYSTRVASTSLLAITSLLASCSSINAINALVFPEYLNPRLKNIAFLNCQQHEESTYIKSTLASCVPYLARISEKFFAYSRTYNADSIGQTTNGDGGDIGSYDVANSRSENDFKDIAEALLIDRSLNVRINLVNHILPLCQFFGVDKTNDIILPHLITYLNDSNYRLRLAFLSSIIDIGYFIGALAFEQYLLPLLFQTLGDHEQFVVIKVLEIFHFFVEKRLINPAVEFNVLSVYKELLANSTTLLLQPNEWIRQSVLYLILSISENLLYAERFCFLYPSIKSYLSYDVSTLDWNTLYPCLTKPLSRQVYEATFTWLNNATNRSIFWKQSNFSAILSNGKRKLISFTKDMGKSIYVPNSNSPSKMNGAPKSQLDIPLSQEDRQWILKLKAVGLDDKDLWKIFALKDHFLNLKRSSSFAGNKELSEFELASNVNVPPKNIFFEVCYKSEPISQGSRVTETSYQPPDTSTYSIRSGKDSNSLILPHSGKARASLQTVETNVLGQLEFNHEGPDSRNKHHHHIHLTNRLANMTHRVFSVNNQKLISASMKHNFGGSNPYILKYLQNISFVPTLEDFPEFGQVIKSTRESLPPNVKDMSFQGNLVAQINASANATDTEAITKIVVCPTSEFFVTGSEFGNLKIWDTTKLDKNISGKNASATVNLELSITDIVFIPHRFVFAVATMDGQLRIFKVHVTRGKNKKITKYSKIALIRSCKIEDGYPLGLGFATTNSKTLCFAITSTCKIVAYDIITMEIEYTLQNPLYLGVPTTFIVHKSVGWLLLGTSDGILCLWDLRFHVLTRAWRVLVDQVSKVKSPIEKMMFVLPPHGYTTTSAESYFAMIGGSNEPDITVWEIPSFECRQVYIANESAPRLKPYALQEIELNKEMSVEDILADLSLDLETENDRSNTALTYSSGGHNNDNKGGYYVTATDDGRIILWNVDNVSKSVLLFTEREVNYTKNQISLRFSVAYEKTVPGTTKKVNDTQTLVHDTITDLAVVSRPYQMVIGVERNGTIFAYK